MNVELARRIADEIERHPSLYDQATWGDNDLDPPAEVGGKCGTPCCIGGWAKHLLREAAAIGPPDAYRTMMVVYDALELPEHPDYSILGADWPTGWLERAGSRRTSAQLQHRPPVRPEYRHRVQGMFQPTAIEAVTILRAMADEGKWWR